MDSMWDAPEFVVLLMVVVVGAAFWVGRTSITGQVTVLMQQNSLLTGRLSAALEKEGAISIEIERARVALLSLQAETGESPQSSDAVTMTELVEAIASPIFDLTVSNADLRAILLGTRDRPAKHSN